VNDKYHDLHRPIEGDATLQLFKFDTPEGKHCFWHSSAHVLGQAMEKKYGAHLTVGPALEEGFYYDADILSSKILTPVHLLILLLHATITLYNSLNCYLNNV
jgi:threonyl-tRNA synthetase